MTTSLTGVKSGRPVSFFVIYSGNDRRYVGREFSVEIHDVSQISESPDKTNLPPVRGLERTVVMVNSVRTPKPDPKMTSSDFDSQPILLSGRIPEEIRPELEETIRKEVQNFGYTLTNTHFIYPQQD